MRLLISLLAAAVVASAADPFPLNKGNQWVYGGTVKVQAAPGTDRLAERRITWKMTVLDHRTESGLEIATVSGLPQDLAGWGSTAKPETSLIVRRGRSYYLLRTTEVDPDQLTPDTLLLELPLRKGKLFGDPKRVADHDPIYCWSVEDFKDGTYGIIYRTNPDHQIIEFRPGTGITRYIYSHHGTPDEVDVRLIRFIPAR